MSASKATSPGKRTRHPVGKSAYAGPRAPVRVMQIVETLAEVPEGMSLVLLAERLEIPKTSLLNHLRVMLGTGYVALKNARYVLGPSAIRLGTIIVAGSTVPASIEQVSKRLTEDSGESTLIGMLDEGRREAIFIRVVEGRQPIRFGLAVGTRWPLHSIAIGRALLAFQGDEYISAYLAETKIERFNARTVTDRGKLRKILGQVRTERLAYVFGGPIADAGGIASPLFDSNGQVKYAIGVAGPHARLELERSRLSRLVLAAAKDASWALGAPRANSEP